MLDGQAEVAWITAALQGANIAVFDEMPDDNDVPRRADGSVAPYCVVDYSDPIPAARDRGLGDDSVQPHILAASILNVGATKADVRDLSAKVNATLIGKTPATNGNASQLRGLGSGFNYTVRDANGAPSRFHRFRFVECTINLATPA